MEKDRDYSNNIGRILTYPVTEDGIRIRDFLKHRRFPQAVLSQLKRNPRNLCLEAGSARAPYQEGNLPVFPYGENQPLFRPMAAGEILKVRILEEKVPSLQLTPVKIDLEVIYEDEDILVLNKPAGMSIHPSLRHYEDSLANALLYRTRSRGERDLVFRCINRLDKETSGLTILAKHMLSGAILSQDVSSRRIHRTYVALVENPGEKDLLLGRGRVDLPIGRAEDSAIFRCIDPVGGQRAVTDYQVFAPKEGLSPVILKLQTGRTHQIRVHMKAIGHPLPGDYLYHPVYDRVGRVPLHSARLVFHHPITGQVMDLFAPFPRELLELTDWDQERLREQILNFSKQFQENVDDSLSGC
ncbi:MAG: RluA family pseudouridine synthase [Lachnospiraceae bacterium]|nr:RluA family pseudouridine synthase [Lachnospiraceae bacterium]